jgi:hypothetical protein
MLGAGRLSLIWSDPTQYDPFWNNVVLLLGFENTLADASTSSQTLTLTGTSTYQTSPAKFDTYSINLPKGANYLNIANTSSFYFGTGNFTIETWVYAPTSIFPNGWVSSNVCVMDISQKNNGVNGGPSFFGLSTSTSAAATVTAFRTAVYDNTDMGFITSDVVLPTNAWHHIVTGRQGSTFYLGTNGTLKTAGTSSKNWFPYSVKIKQDFFNEYQYNVNYDEFRVTTGVWRYGTGTNYTVPTARFPRQ